MTREEAIDLLDNLIGMVEDNHHSDYDAALQMAIKALEQMPVTTTTEEGGVIYYPQVEGVTPTVIDAGKQEHSTVNCNECFHDCPQWAKNIAKSNGCTGYISSAQPKTGHWIKKDGYSDCSECGSHIVTEWDYCPKCGAKMIKPQERSGEE